MARQDRILESLMAALKQSEKKTSAYDTSAVVRRIEDGIAWVHIPGGVDETPVMIYNSLSFSFPRSWAISAICSSI